MIYKISSLLLIQILFLGCEKIIEVELPKSEPQIVIEANISNHWFFNNVLISTSRDFDNQIKFDYNQYDWNFRSFIIKTNGDSVLFHDFNPNYHNRDFVPVPENSYSIVVIYNDITYEATSYYPKPISINEITAKKKRNHLTNKSYYELHCIFQDNPEIEDFARFSIRVNGKLYNDIFTYNDRLTDGNLIDYNEFRLESGSELLFGDTVSVIMYTIDEDTYNYYETLKSAIASADGIPLGQMTPSNPTTNWSNGALGYFSANSRDYERIIIGKPNERL